MDDAEWDQRQAEDRAAREIKARTGFSVEKVSPIGPIIGGVSGGGAASALTGGLPMVQVVLLMAVGVGLALWYAADLNARRAAAIARWIETSED